MARVRGNAWGRARHPMSGAIEGFTGERMAPGPDDAAVGISTHPLLERVGVDDACSDFLNPTKAFARQTCWRRTDPSGRGKIPVTGQGQSLAFVTRVSLRTLVGKEPSGHLI
jgi:hypothetical protein